jgi:hypothetical protein
MNKRKPDRIEQLALWAGGILVAVVLCLSVQAETVGSAFAPTPTPTPVVFPRDYDPPAPDNLTLPVARQPVKTLDVDGYPRIVKLWGGYDDRVGIDFYAQYDVLISQSFTDEQLSYLRAKNPDMIVLYTGLGTYDLDNGPLGSQWITATEGMPEFECFYRGVDDGVLRVNFWNHGMFNMSDEWCADAIVDYLVSEVGAGMGMVYDGVFFDRVHQAITPYVVDGIDLYHDGLVDDQNLVNELHWHGMERFLDEVRQRLGDGIVVLANDAPLFFASRLNGREYESFMRSILEGGPDWTWFRRNYEQWMQASREPRLTMVMGNPPGWWEARYGLYPYYKMAPAMVDEAAAHYRQMRFGLTTALMEGGLYGFEFGTTWHGNAWWYDEYDGAGLGKGYLGMPLGEAYNALGPLTTANVVRDPGFGEPGLNAWTLQTAGGALATMDRVAMTTPYAVTGTTVARTVVSSSTGQLDDVRLAQTGIPLAYWQWYTLSFWARADVPLWNVRASVHASGNPANTYGLDERIEMGTTWQHYSTPFTATTSTGAAELSLAIGQYTGTVWLDEVRLQEGWLPAVYRRDFNHGVALCNATTEPQTVPLGGPYRRIAGTQAPLVKIIIDDTHPSTPEFNKEWGGWAGVLAEYDEWGDSYHYSVTTTNPDGFIGKAIWRPDIPRAGSYDVYVWVAPHANCNDLVTYEVQHAGGTTPAVIDPRVSEPAWVKLGTYPFDVGAGNSVTLLNLTHSTWVVADAVKFESVRRYNDGASVDSVTLQGQDGIILLNALDLPHKVYLPFVGKENWQ